MIGRRPTPEVAVAAAFVASVFLSGVDMQIVNVILPTLSRDFGAPLSAVQWTAISYVLALAVLIPASGWIGDRFGAKPTFIFALALFTLGSALCGAVSSLGELIAARTLQGAAGGMMMTSAMAMLFRTFAPERRARVSRIVMLPILVGPASAPILGGMFTQWLSWRWVFLFNVPFGVAMALFAWRFLPRTPAGPTERLDLWGMVLSGLGLSSLLYAVSEGSTLGWASASVVISGGAGLVLLTSFVKLSLRRPDPILRIRLLSDRLFRATTIVFVLTTGPFLGTLYLTPIFLQDILHQSPIGSGTTTFLEAVGVAIGSQTLLRLYPRSGPRPLATLGGAGLVVFLGAFLLVGPTTNLWYVRVLMLFGGFVNSGTFMAVQTAMFTTIPAPDIGHASAIYQTQRQTTIALSIALLTTIAAGSAGGSVASFHAAYLVAAVIAAAGALSAFTLIRTRDAHATMTAIVEV